MDKQWRNNLADRTNGACSGCDVCDGAGCRGQIPGMGGLGSGQTFMNNFLSWEQVEVSLSDLSNGQLPGIGVAPMTGVDENMGDPMPEADFHRTIVAGAKKAGILSCIGDGTPDYKLQSGAQALRDNGVTGSVFFKPYANERLFERYEWVKDTAKTCGLDIDSHKILTMQGKAQLEKKDAASLIRLKKHFHQPFAVKGVFTEEDVAMMEEVRPDIIVVSNHGGRVGDHQEGIALTLQRYASRLKRCCGELWVDGGIRRREHLIKAAAMGVDRVLIGRPFVQGTAVLGDHGVSRVLEESFGIFADQSPVKAAGSGVLPVHSEL